MAFAAGGFWSWKQGWVMVYCMDGVLLYSYCLLLLEAFVGVFFLNTYRTLRIKACAEDLGAR